MKAIILHGKENISLGEFPTPELHAGEVKVAVAYCGICGSDLPRVFSGASYFYPIVLGHEFSGEVAALGKNVTHLSVGDRVSGVPLIPCMKCSDCLKGNYSLCKKYAGKQGSSATGGFAHVLDYFIFKLC